MAAGSDDRRRLCGEAGTEGSADADRAGEATGISGDYATARTQQAPEVAPDETSDPVGADNIAQGRVGGRMGTAHPSEGQGHGG